jgi:hypothetical protein
VKVADDTQPYDGVLPPAQSSIGLIVYNSSLEVAREAQITEGGRAVPPEDPARLAEAICEFWRTERWCELTGAQARSAWT